VAKIGCDALEPADRDRLSVDATAAARRLARPIARAPENSRKDVRLAVEQVRVGVLSLRDEPQVLRHIRMGRARPLAVYNLMVVARIGDVGGRHSGSLSGR